MGTYAETIEWEKRAKLRGKADVLLADFRRYVKLDIGSFIGNGRFKDWTNQDSAIFIDVSGMYPIFQCRFSHETYTLVVSEEGIFQGLVTNCRSVHHLAAFCTRMKNRAESWVGVSDKTP